MRARFAAVFLCVGLLSGCGGEGGPLAVHDIQPRMGPSGGGKSVEVTGSNFEADVGYTVYFGPNKAAQVLVKDTKTLMVLTPPASKAGAVDVTIMSDSGDGYKIEAGYDYQGEGASKNTGNLKF